MLLALFSTSFKSNMRGSNIKYCIDVLFLIFNDVQWTIPKPIPKSMLPKMLQNSTETKRWRQSITMAWVCPSWKMRKDESSNLFSNLFCSIFTNQMQAKKKGITWIKTSYLRKIDFVAVLESADSLAEAGFKNTIDKKQEWCNYSAKVVGWCLFPRRFLGWPSLSSRSPL